MNFARETAGNLIPLPLAHSFSSKERLKYNNVNCIREVFINLNTLKEIQESLSKVIFSLYKYFTMSYKSYALFPSSPGKKELQVPAIRIIKS